MTDMPYAINHLADKLDRRLPAGTLDTPTSDPDPLLKVAIRLAKAPHPALSSQAMARIQAQVVAVHRRQFARAKPRLRVYSFTRYLAVASAILVLFFAGFVPAMASSVPGEILYPVKTVLENVELTLATSDEARANVYLTHAERRTIEANILLARGTFDEMLVTRALDSLLDSAAIAEREQNLSNLSDLQGRAARLDTTLEAVLLEAETRQLAPVSTIAMLHNSLDAVHENGEALLPETIAPVEVTPDVVETDTPTAVLTHTAIPTDDPTTTQTTVPSATPIVEVTVELTPEITAEVTQSVEATSTMTAIIRASQSVNVRKGPGLQYVVIATLPPDTTVPLLGWSDDGAWLNILLKDGTSGWIASSLSNLYDLAPANGGTQGGNASQGSNNNQGTGGDFGCEHAGNFCNAPGQNITPPGQGGSNPGQGGDQGQGGGKP